MHTFFEAIGLSRIKSANASEKLIRDAIMHFDERCFYKNDNDLMHAAFTKYYAEDLGVTVCGEFDDKSSFHPEFSFPVFRAKTVSMKQVIDYEKHLADDSYGGICDDPRIGTSIIFYLSNIGEYMLRRSQGTIEDTPLSIHF